MKDAESVKSNFAGFAVFLCGIIWLIGFAGFMRWSGVVQGVGDIFESEGSVYGFKAVSAGADAGDI